MLNYSVVPLLKGVNRSWRSVSKEQLIMEMRRGRQPAGSGASRCLKAICIGDCRFGEGHSVIMKESGSIAWREGGDTNAAKEAREACGPGRQID